MVSLLSMQETSGQVDAFTRRDLFTLHVVGTPVCHRMAVSFPYSCSRHGILLDNHVVPSWVRSDLKIGCRARIATMTHASRPHKAI